MSVQEKILVVDDERGPRESVRMILKDEYDVIAVDRPKKALEELKREEIDLAILDIRMPEMDGIELLSEIKRMDSSIEVLMVTGYANVDSAVKAMRFGAFDYLSKPFDKDELESMVKRGLKRRAGGERSVSPKDIKHDSMIKSLLATIDAKDSYTSAHSQEVAETSILIARKMGCTEKEIENLRQAALVHDIGKIGVSEEILRKRGALTESEFEIIKKHPEIGSQILRPIDPGEELISSVYHHHERYDGKGYPAEIAGKEIPLLARILAVADTYSAMTTDRPYRKKLGKGKMISEFEKSVDAQFDPEVVKAIIEIINEKEKAKEGKKAKSN